jgi:hypothetical protein
MGSGYYMNSYILPYLKVVLSDWSHTLMDWDPREVYQDAIDNPHEDFVTTSKDLAKYVKDMLKEADGMQVDVIESFPGEYKIFFFR